MTDAEVHQATSTAIGAVTTTAGRLISSLPAQFLVLVLLNTVFILSLLSFLEKQEQARERIYTPLLSSCMNQIPLPMVQELLRSIGK
jgi:hypothetical protein